MAQNERVAWKADREGRQAYREGKGPDLVFKWRPIMVTVIEFVKREEMIQRKNFFLSLRENVEMMFERKG